MNIENTSIAYVNIKLSARFIFFFFEFIFFRFEEICKIIETVKIMNVIQQLLMPLKDKIRNLHLWVNLCVNLTIANKVKTIYPFFRVNTMSKINKLAKLHNLWNFLFLEDQFLHSKLKDKFCNLINKTWLL